MQVLWIFILISSAYAADLRSLPRAKALLRTNYEWKYFDYVWKYPAQKEEFIRSGRYDPKKMVPVDVDRADGRTFVTVIRTAGVPASLHTVSNYKSESGPLLDPYPNWSWYEEANGCEGIINVYRVAIDRCNRLWVLDTGKIDGKHVCQEKLLVFDLDIDTLLFRKEIPKYAARNWKGKSQLDTLIVDVEGSSCVNTTVYLADALSKSLVMFKDDRFIPVIEEGFEAEEHNAHFDIAGEQFHMTDGLSIALSPSYNNNRYLVLRPLASRSLYSANTQELMYSTSKINISKEIDVLPSQASAMAFSIDGTLFYGLTHEIAIGCYNMYRPSTSENFKIAVQDDERLQFASGMKVLRTVTLMGDTLLIMTNRLQKIRAGTMDFNEINFRVMTADIDDLTSGTACDRPRKQEE